MILGNHEKMDHNGQQDLAGDSNRRMDALRRREEEAKRRQVWLYQFSQVDLIFNVEKLILLSEGGQI